MIYEFFKTFSWIFEIFFCLELNQVLLFYTTLFLLPENSIYIIYIYIIGYTNVDMRPWWMRTQQKYLPICQPLLIAGNHTNIIID